MAAHRFSDRRRQFRRVSTRIRSPSVAESRNRLALDETSDCRCSPCSSRSRRCTVCTNSPHRHQLLDCHCKWSATTYQWELSTLAKMHAASHSNLLVAEFLAINFFNNLQQGVFTNISISKLSQLESIARWYSRGAYPTMYRVLMGSVIPIFLALLAMQCSAKRNVISLGLPIRAVYSSSLPVIFYKHKRRE